MFFYVFYLLMLDCGNMLCMRNSCSCLDQYGNHYNYSISHDVLRNIF